MSTYESEIIEFLIKKGNFEQMVNVMNHYEKVRTHLITGFWDKVEASLREIKSNDWAITKTSDYFEKYSYMGLMTSDWNSAEQGEENPLKVIFEMLYGHMYYGLRVNNMSKVLNAEKVRARGKELFKDPSFRYDGGHYWIFFKHYDLNFHQSNSLSRILPDKNDGEAMAAANLILELAEESRGRLNELYQLKK